ASKLPKEEAAALLNENQHELIEAAKAYVELLKWQALNTAMHTFDDDPRRADEAKALRRIRDLYGLTLIERSIGWHIMYGRLSMNRARQVGPAINRLCAKLAGNAADLVAAFGYGPEHRRATIAEGV
ncbi:acyl-CoA dehydrogenase, partial [Salmonella enterica]